MKKLKKLAAGVVFAGTAFCVAPAVAFTPLAERAVFAADGAITVEEGDAFEIRETLNAVAGNIRLADESADFDVLSQETNPGSTEGTYDFYAMCLINTPGEYEVIIEDENNNVLKTVSVKVTDMSGDDPSGEEDTSGEQGSGEGSEDVSGEDVSGGDAPGNNSGDTSGEGQQTSDDEDETDLVDFIPVNGGEISGYPKSGEIKPGETYVLKAEPDEGFAFRKWVIRNMDGRVITDNIDISEDGTFTLPDYPIWISAEFEYYLIHEIELLDVTETLEVGKPVTFTGHVKDNTDTRFFLLAECWINEYDTKGITGSKDINATLQKEGITLLDNVAAGDKYNYSVMFMTTEGYEFADDVKLIYKGEEYTPAKDLDELDGLGKETLVFNGFLSFGEQTNPKETKTSTKTVTKQETRTETVTQYVYKTYTYTTYEYVTRVAGSPGAVKTVAASTGDTNYTAVWIALAVAAGGGVVSGILVGRRRKRNK